MAEDFSQSSSIQHHRHQYPSQAELILLYDEEDELLTQQQALPKGHEEESETFDYFDESQQQLSSSQRSFYFQDDERKDYFDVDDYDEEGDEGEIVGDEYEQEDRVIFAEPDEDDATSPLLFWQTMPSVATADVKEDQKEREQLDNEIEKNSKQSSISDEREVVGKSSGRNFRRRGGRRNSLMLLSSQVGGGQTEKQYGNFFLDKSEYQHESDNRFQSVLNEDVCVSQDEGCEGQQSMKQTSQSTEKDESHHQSPNIEKGGRSSLESTQSEMMGGVLKEIRKKRRRVEKKRPPSPPALLHNESKVLAHMRTLAGQGNNLSKTQCYDKLNILNRRLEDAKKRFQVSKQSIVGTRPLHWGRENTGKKVLSRHVKKSLLSQATKSRSLYARRSTSKCQMISSKTIKRRESSFVASTQPRSVDIKSMTFRLSTKKTSNNNSQEVTQVTNANPMTPQKSGMMSSTEKSLLSAGFSATPRRITHKKKRTTGFFSGKLRSIRGMIEGNCARLHSGSYPFRQYGKRGDVNDPRNRAQCFVDVTLVQNPVEHERHYVALAYAHQFVIIKKKNITDRNEDDNEICSRTNLDLKGYVWIYFLQETLRACDIQKKTQLRIYNVIAVKVERKGNLRNETLFGRQNYESKSTITVRYALICSQVCEVYPSFLPPLELP